MKTPVSSVLVFVAAALCGGLQAETNMSCLVKSGESIAYNARLPLVSVPRLMWRRYGGVK